MSAAVRPYNHAAAASLIALLFLCLAWELWLAPVRPGGSWLAPKALPLLAPLFGILRGTRYTHQWVPLLALLYLAEGIVRASTEQGPSGRLAMAETILACTLSGSSALYARMSGNRESGKA